MARTRTPRPTDGELAILRVLWRNGPGTVREIHALLTRVRPTGYTTVLKLLQIMIGKGLVTRDPRARPHVYHPRHAEEHTQRQLVRDLLERAFGGARMQLFVQALAAEPATPAELTEIRRLLDAYEHQRATTESHPRSASGDRHEPAR